MLFVFYVDTGTTITFDIKLALQTVAQLMEAIHRECGVEVKHQVLLMSGGECLEPEVRVCSYAAGTDTNPIYLFSKAAIDSQIPPTPCIDYGSDVDLQCQIDTSLAMPATYQTLVSRAQLAQQCCGLAREQTRICEKLVHDQHLQQQGWAAVIANLEDITQTYRTRSAFLQETFDFYLNEREQHLQLLSSFNADLEALAKLPILPALRAHAEGFLSPEDEADRLDPEREKNAEILSLLRWISAKDNQSTLEQLVNYCSRGLEKYTEETINTLKDEAAATFEAAGKQEMKEIKGLGERLFALEQLMQQTKRLVQEQGELAQGFVQNQNRANNLGDPSILPDLCTSHRRQLLVMLQNHNQLRDIRRRCTKAKEELSANIFQRLKWITYVENRLMEVDARMYMYHDSLRRLRRHIEVVQQIHLAPQLYLSAVAEVVRRRTFSQAFLGWASNLACQLLTVHSEELERRREFESKFDGHFLNSLFPGLEDMPPPFATQAPSVFDRGLPKLTVDDMNSLRAVLPNMELAISTPDLDSITQFFLSKSLTEGSCDGNKEKDSSSMPVDVPAKDQEQASVPMQTDRGGFESETDTEEFEKISQGAGDSKPSSFDGAKQKRQKQLEENLGSTRDEVERLRNILKTTKTVICESIMAVKQELAVLKDRYTIEKGAISETIQQVRQALTMYSREHERCLVEREQELALEHEIEMIDVKEQVKRREEEVETVKQTLLEKETELAEHERLISTMRQKLDDGQTEMRNLQSRLCQQLNEALDKARVEKEAELKETNDERSLEIATLTSSLAQCRTRIEELEENLNEARNEQQRMVKDVSDKLMMEYKTELETIRSRFKLMAASTMERSPSDSSLEKIERPDLIELVNHEAILAQAKEDMKLEKSEAVRTAVEKERADCIAKLNQELELARQMIEDKDREVKTYRLREVALTEECEQYKDTIRQLTESENIVRQTFKEKVENLEAKQVWLESKIEQQDKKFVDRLDMRHSGLEEAISSLQFEKDDVEASESKKVRLEADGDISNLMRRLEMLEGDNKRLSTELQMVRQSKQTADIKLEVLMKENVDLMCKLQRSSAVTPIDEGPSCSSKKRDKDMSTSVAVISESASRDGACSSSVSQRSPSVGCFHSSSHIRKKLTKITAKLVQQGCITVTSCNTGDIVLVLWDALHRNYTLYQDSPTLFFLNSDCISALDLGMNPDGTPKRVQTIAEVVEKEYCHARKAENRYHVPLGTKFYRVRVKSVDKQFEASLLTKSQQQ